MNEQEFSELSAGYALNALSLEDARLYTAGLRDNPDWIDIAAADVATAAFLARGVAQVAPPLATRGVLLSLISRTPQYPRRPSGPIPGFPFVDDLPAESGREPLGEPPVTAEGHSEPPVVERAQRDETPDASVENLVEPPREPVVERAPTDVVQTVARRSWMRGVFALAASLVLLVTLGFGAALIGQQLSRTPAQIALERIENAPDAQTAVVASESGGEVTAQWSESLGEAVILTHGLPALASGQTYQMWFIREDQVIVSAGLFITDRAGESTSVLDGTVENGDTIAVSVEPAGGSQQPTTTPIVAIPTST